MNRVVFIVALVLTVAGCGGITQIIPPTPNPTQGTHVRLMRGLGGAALSPGVDQIAQQAASIPGVTLVSVYEYTQYGTIANEVNSEPLTVREFVGGYSCGANASPDASTVNRRVEMMAVIQASLWCGGSPIPKNVMKAQETYNPACAQTAGLGCKLLDLAPGFNPSNFTVIDRPDCHPCADVDPDAQNDMLDAIRSVTTASAAKRYGTALGARVPGAINVITRYHGQRIY